MKYVKLFFSYRALQFEKHGFEKNAFKVFSSKNGGRTWRDKKIHDFHNFSNSGLKFYMRISECICNRIMMKKKYRFFDPFTGEAPLKLNINRQKFINTFDRRDNSLVRAPVGKGRKFLVFYGNRYIGVFSIGEYEFSKFPN